MYRTTNALLLATLLSSACGSQTNPPTLTDGGVISGQDLSGSTTPTLGQVESTTIRDLNSDKFPTGTHVRVVGVMESPITAAYAVQFDQACLFETIVVQADPTPTLKDGIVVRYIKRGVATGDMMVHASDCQQLVTNKIAMGDSVVIQGTLVVSNGIHSIDLGTLGSVVSMGRAQTMPQPVAISSAQLPSVAFGSPLAQQFAGAYGALVSLQPVVTSESHGPTLTFKVSASATDANKTRVSTEYLQLLNPGYVPPADGTMYKSVTGLVSTDLGGTILPRGTTDLIP